MPSEFIGFVAVALVLAFGPNLFSQVTTGEIVGTVMDQSGGVIPGAEVAITNEGTAFTAKTTTGGDGRYVFTPVKVGSYEVKATAQGFTAIVQQHVTVDIEQHVVVNFTLRPGSVTQTVEVTAAPALLQSETASVGQVVTTREINDLPLNGRNFTFLAQLSAGVSVMQSSSGRGLELNGMFVANGTRGTQQNYMLNGIDNNNTEPDLVSGTAYSVLPPIDALQEFKVQTSNYSAELGRAAGAVLNATLKSGTNQLHGDAWDFLRNDKLDAADFFENSSGILKSEFRRNQFGFTLGGPVVIPGVYNGRNKTFFFFAYEGLEIRQGSAFLTTVPTAAERSSGYTNFSDANTGQPAPTPADLLGRTFPTGQIFDPATTRSVTSGQVDPVTGLVATGTGYVRDAFAGNLLPANRLDPNAIKLLNLYPAPTLSGLLNNFAGNPVGYTNGPAFDPRLDEIFSDRDQAFLSFSYNGLNSLAPPPFPGIAIGGNTFNCLRTFQGDLASFGENHSFSPTMINAFEVGFTYLHNSYTPSDAGTMGIPAQFGIQGIPQTPQNGGLPYITIGPTGGLNFLGVNGVLPTYKNGNTWDIRDNLTKIHGKHVIKVGFETQYNFFSFLIPPKSRGSFAFNGSYTSIPGKNVALVGPGTAQFLLTPIAATVANGINNVGGASTVGGSNAVQTVEVRHYYAGYFQDDWKATHKLSLNLGVRWDYFTPTTNRFDAETNFVPGAASQWLFHTSRQNNPTVSPGFITTMQKDGINIVYAGSVDGTTPRDDFAPRVGFAYQLKPALVIRGGYGIFYNDLEASSGGDHLPSDNYPFLFNYSFAAPDPAHPVTANNSIGLLENGLLNFPLTPAASSGVGLSPIGRQLIHKTPYSQGANFTLQYQLGAHQTVQLGYVGTFSRHLALTAGANWVSQMLPPLVSFVPYLPYPDLSPDFNYITDNGNSYYHSLQFTFERRFSTGLTVLGNYTYSKCKSDAQDQLNGTLGSYRAPFVPGYGIQGDYGLCEYDVRNIVHLSGIYPLPFGKGGKFLGQAKGLTNAVVGGWTTNWILSLQDGFPISIPCTITTTAQLGCAADLVPGQDPIGGPHNVNQWLNPAAFTNPPVATSIGQSSLAPLGGSLTPVAGPGFHRLDFSLFKQFRTSERTNLEFRADVFNLTNTPNLSDTSLNTTFSSPGFGRITATRDNPNDPREIQLALKLYW